MHIYRGMTYTHGSTNPHRDVHSSYTHIHMYTHKASTHNHAHAGVYVCTHMYNGTHMCNLHTHTHEYTSVQVDTQAQTYIHIGV